MVSETGMEVTSQKERVAKMGDKPCKTCVFNNPDAKKCHWCKHCGDLVPDETDPVIDYYCFKHCYYTAPWESCEDFEKR